MPRPTFGSNTYPLGPTNQPHARAPRGGHCFLRAPGGMTVRRALGFLKVCNDRCHACSWPMSTGEKAQTLDAKSPAPRFEPTSQWATLPVQPPAGTWQLRAARVFPALVVNIVIFFLLALTTHRNSVTWVPVWILLTCGILQAVFFFVVGIRGAQ